MTGVDIVDDLSGNVRCVVGDLQCFFHCVEFNIMAWFSGSSVNFEADVNNLTDKIVYSFSESKCTIPRIDRWLCTYRSQKLQCSPHRQKHIWYWSDMNVVEILTNIYPQLLSPKTGWFCFVSASQVWFLSHFSDGGKCTLYPCKANIIVPLITQLDGGSFYQKEIIFIHSARDSCPQLFSSSYEVSAAFIT